MPFAEDQRPVGELGPGGEHEPSAKAFARGQRGGILSASDPRIGEDSVERCGELAGAVADQEPEVGGARRGPSGGCGSAEWSTGRWGCGDPEEVHGLAADLDHEEQWRHWSVIAQSTWRKSGERRRGLGLQELPPGRVGVPFRAGGIRRTAERGGWWRRYPVAEFEQLALDPLISPGLVVGSEPLDQRGDLRAERWPSGPVRVRPLPATMRRCQRRMVPGVISRCIRRRGGRTRDQGGKDGPVGPVQPGPRLSTAQYHDLVPQDEQSDVLGRCLAAEQNQPAADPGEHQVEQTNGMADHHAVPRLPASHRSRGLRLLTPTGGIVDALTGSRA